MKNKYLVDCPFRTVDVYRIIKLFNVTDPGLQQALKKVLFAGQRGYKDQVRDMEEAIQAIQRSIDMLAEESNIECEAHQTDITDLCSAES